MKNTWYTEGRLTALFNNPRITNKKLVELFREQDLTEEHVLQLIEHPNTDTDLLLEILKCYSDNEDIALKIIWMVSEHRMALSTDVACAICKNKRYGCCDSDVLWENMDDWWADDWSALVSELTSWIDNGEGPCGVNILSELLPEVDYLHDYDCFYEEDDDDEEDEEDDDDDDEDDGEFHFSGYDEDEDEYYDQFGNLMDYVEGAEAAALDDAWEK